MSIASITQPSHPAITPRAPSAGADSPTLAIVRIPKPWYLPRALVRRGMARTIGQYAQLPGLDFKAYAIEQASGAFGGLYQWRTRAQADAWFSPKWHARVRRQRGSAADVMLLEAPRTLDNVPGGTRELIGGPTVATLVLLPLAAGMPREVVLAEFQRQLEPMRSVPGLLRKHFLIAGDGRAGGLYLWQDAANAQAWFTQKWRDRVRAAYHAEPELTHFEVPILLPTRAAAAAQS